MAHVPKMLHILPIFRKVFSALGTCANKTLLIQAWAVRLPGLRTTQPKRDNCDPGTPCSSQMDGHIGPWPAFFPKFIRRLRRFIQLFSLRHMRFLILWSLTQKAKCNLQGGKKGKRWHVCQTEPKHCPLLFCLLPFWLIFRIPIFRHIRYEQHRT